MNQAERENMKAFMIGLTELSRKHGLVLAPDFDCCSHANEGTPEIWVAPEYDPVTRWVGPLTIATIEWDHDLQAYAWTERRLAV